MVMEKREKVLGLLTNGKYLKFHLISWLKEDKRILFEEVYETKLLLIEKDNYLCIRN